MLFNLVNPEYLLIPDDLLIYKVVINFDIHVHLLKLFLLSIFLDFYKNPTNYSIAISSMKPSTITPPKLLPFLCSPNINLCHSYNAHIFASYEWMPFYPFSTNSFYAELVCTHFYIILMPCTLSHT